MAYTPEEWFASIPRFTRFWMMGLLGALLLSSVGVVPLPKLLFSWQAVKEFQLWRLFTPFFVFGSGYTVILYLTLMYKYGGELEQSPYPSAGGLGGGTPADFLYMLIVGAGLLLVIGGMMGIGLLGPPLCMMVVYVWSRRNATASVSVWGFGPFLGVYLPWLYVTLNVILGGNPMLDLMGIAAGHIYYFLMVVLPENAQYGYRLLKTPQFLSDLVNGRRQGPNEQPVVRAWQGQGRVLGAQ